MTRANHVIAAVIVGGLLVLSLIVGVMLAAGAATTIGTDGYLASEEAAVDMARNGSVTAAYKTPDITISLAEDAADCSVGSDAVEGATGWLSDRRNEWICLEYGEDVERTFDIYIAAQVWAPYERTEVIDKAGGSTAAYEPVTINGTDYLRVTVTLSESGVSVYPVNREASLAAERIGAARERAENATGVGIASDEEWQRVESDQYGKQRPYAIHAPNGADGLLIEYRTQEGTWQVVPEGGEDFAPVYYEQTTEDEVLVFAPTEDPPELRYTHQASGTTVVESAWREIKDVPSRIDDFLGDLLGVVVVGGVR